MEKARRRHVPAFGEWTYYSSSSSSPDEPELPRSGAAVADCWWYAPEPEACSDVWFRYSPPLRKAPAPKKVRRPEVAPEKQYSVFKASVVPGARPRAPNAGVVVARAPAKGTDRVVRPVDEDLYQVPPAELRLHAAKTEESEEELVDGLLAGPQYY